MAIKLASHLYRSRLGVFYFSVVVPRDLRQCFPHGEIQRSLRTGVWRDAVLRVMSLAAHVTDLFRRLRAMPKKKDEPLQIDMVESMDLTEFGLPPQTWDFDAGNPAEVALVEKRRQELLKLAAERGRITPAVSDTSASTTLSELFTLYADRRAPQSASEGEGKAVTAFSYSAPAAGPLQCHKCIWTWLAIVAGSGQTPETEIRVPAWRPRKMGGEWGRLQQGEAQ